MQTRLPKCRSAVYGLGAALLVLPMGSLSVLAQDGRGAGLDHPEAAPPGPMKPGSGRPDGPPGGGGPLSGLAQAEADQAASVTIAALAKVPLSDVARVVRAWNVPTALRYFDVEPKAFHDAVVLRLKAIVQAAVQAQYVSAADGNRASGDLDRAPPPPHPTE